MCILRTIPCEFQYLELGSELVFSHTSTHSRGRRDTTSDRLDEAISIVCTAPFLVREDVASNLTLTALHKLNVSLHALLSKVFGEHVRDVRIGMETRELESAIGQLTSRQNLKKITHSDELPDEAKLAEFPNVGLHVVLVETSSLPVERRAQVVCEPLAWMHCVDTSSELLGLSQDRFLGLHPEEIGVRSEGVGTVDGALGTTLVPVVTLTGTRGIPVPVGHSLETKLFLRDGDGLGVGEAGNGGGELVCGCLAGALLEESLSKCLGEKLEVGSSDPLVLNGLELVAVLACSLSLDHDVVEWSEAGVGAAKDEGVVAVVDVGSEEGGSLRVCSCNDEVLDTEDVVLETDGNQTVDVLRDGDEDLAGHVSTLLRTRSLVFDVDSSCTLLNEELGELHDGSETTVTSVRIGNDGPEVVDLGCFGEFGFRHTRAGLALFSVVEELCHEEVLDLVGDGVGRVVCCSPFSFNTRRRCTSDIPARSGPGSLVLDAVLDDCQPET